MLLRNLNDEEECQLFDTFSYIVQALLALGSFSILICNNINIIKIDKRQKEKPPRPWKIWFFDISKQICSALTQHMLNLFLSVLMETIKTKETKKDECVWYFLNFFLDTSIGILICYLFMKIANIIIEKYDISFLKSGFYFEVKYKKGKPRYKLKMMMYFSQLILWELIIILNKILMFGLNYFCQTIFFEIGTNILSPFAWNKKLKLIMVMVIFPVIFNSVQFWVFDEILKFKLEPNSNLMEIAIESDKQQEIENNNESTLELNIDNEEEKEREKEKVIEKNSVIENEEH